MLESTEAPVDRPYRHNLHFHRVIISLLVLQLTNLDVRKRRTSASDSQTIRKLMAKTSLTRRTQSADKDVLHNIHTGLLILSLDNMTSHTIYGCSYHVNTNLYHWISNRNGSTVEAR